MSKCQKPNNNVNQIYNWFSANKNGDFIKHKNPKGLSFALSGRLGETPTGTWEAKKEGDTITITRSDNKETTLKKEKNKYRYILGNGKNAKVKCVEITKNRKGQVVLNISFTDKKVSLSASERKIEDKNETLKKDVKKMKKSIRKADLKGKLRKEAFKVGKAAKKSIRQADLKRKLREKTFKVGEAVKKKKRRKFTDDNIEDLVSVQLKF